ncbi:hypothetical protein AAWM_02699 [Aspergillus awamori]|uniref:Uncharacterized protein n=1 Tax=Aspergillus awamori TaxID=105351 RepID=A0A401KKF2_ASPAW|nr:hypothetical protein AAWM_02699 [Aspergillus awamori]GKZ58534.1 hypothetical protein AnigIFM49718_004359 [Aspergillus niger]
MAPSFAEASHLARVFGDNLMRSRFGTSPAGTLGNAHEYTDLLEWYAETFFVDLEEGQEDEDIMIFNEDVCRAINERRVVDYEAFLARCRELPGVNYEKLYLMPGDTGYVLWTSAKRLFRTAVTEALNW